MKILPLLVVLLVAAPAFAQSRVFTNADLGKALTSSARLDPAAAAAILAPHQQPVYVDLRPRWTFPQITVLNSSPTTGPFGQFAPFDPPRRLDGSLLSERPWHVTTYQPFPYGYGSGFRGPSGPSIAAPPTGAPRRSRR